MQQERSLLHKKLCFVLVIIFIGTSTFLKAQTEPPKDITLEDPFSGNYRYFKLGYQQMDAGFFTAGAKFVRWEKSIFFKSHTLEYGYNPWDKLHLMKYNADLTITFVNFGFEMSSVTNGEQFNVEFRPQIGAYFIYFGAYFGPNIWVNQHFRDQLNRWTFNVEVNIPIR